MSDVCDRLIEIAEMCQGLDEKIGDVLESLKDL